MSTWAMFGLVTITMTALMAVGGLFVIFALFLQALLHGEFVMALKALLFLGVVAIYARTFVKRFRVKA